MLESRTVLIQKDPIKSNAVGNYRPMAYLNLLWKLLIRIITDTQYEYLENQDLLPEEKKRCSRWLGDTKTSFS